MDYQGRSLTVPGAEPAADKIAQRDASTILVLADRFLVEHPEVKNANT